MSEKINVAPFQILTIMYFKIIPIDKKKLNTESPKGLKALFSGRYQDFENYFVGIFQTLRK